MRVQSVTGENMSRKVFDYRAQEQMEIDVQFDQLDTEQKRRLNEALEQIQQETLNGIRKLMTIRHPEIGSVRKETAKNIVIITRSAAANSNIRAAQICRRE